MIPRVHDFTSPRVHGSTILRFHDSTIPRFYDSTILRFYDSTIPRFHDSTIPRFSISDFLLHFFFPRVSQIYSVTFKQGRRERKLSVDITKSSCLNLSKLTGKARRSKIKMKEFRSWSLQGYLTSADFNFKANNAYGSQVMHVTLFAICFFSLLSKVVFQR